MAVIVKQEGKGKFLFESVKGLGISDEEKEKAKQLNKVVMKKMAQLTARLEKSGIVAENRARNKVKAYWEFGNELRKIVSESGLVDPKEKKLFWQNIRMHASEGLLAEDRGPNRIHIDYCFRLAGYPRKFALKRKWSEWVYLFDSPTINKELRFDHWDKKLIEKKEPAYIKREKLRLFVRCINAILKNIETSDLDDEELWRCYNGGWELAKSMKDDKEIEQLKDVQRNVGKLLSGEIKPKDFAYYLISHP